MIPGTSYILSKCDGFKQRGKDISGIGNRMRKSAVVYSGDILGTSSGLW
jgi:hypothetical protein